jgi:long-chain acyl-CoA synthetase
MRWLGEQVAAIAAVEPRRPALGEAARQLSYGALWSEAERFADLLRARGAREGDRVALLLPSTIEAVVAWYGTWLAGCTVIPLNVQARARDFESWLRHAEASVVVCEAGHEGLAAALAAVPGCSLHITVDRFRLSFPIDWLGSGRVAHPPPPPPHPAVVLYTSGTTGKPKAVMLSHANMVANTTSIVTYLGLTCVDSIVTSLPFYYSYGSSVLHTHLHAGARVVIESNLIFPHALVQSMARERATGFSGVPSTFSLLLQRVQLDNFDLSSLRYLTQAGGAMGPALTLRVRDAFPQAKLFVMYGQTEATARIAYLPPERLLEKIGSVGVPIPGVSIEVRREDGTRAPAREEGEVWVRGPNVMLGFLGDPAATRAVIKDGWLATGDMGALDDEGFLFLAGRRSDMIKSGAHRIHPSDVEEVIAELPDVTEVAVVGVDDEMLGQSVKAFVVVRAPIASDRIKAHCRDRLATYKIPREIVFVPELPKTASGKVQRARLLQPVASA